MKPAQKSVLSLTVVGTLLCGATSVWADGPKVLTSRQLDHVTAGSAVVSSTDAMATGSLSLTSTTSNSVVGGSQPFKGQPGLINSAGVADGTAAAVGNNGGLPGVGPASATTSVFTAGIAEGSQMYSSTVNQTIQGAGGVVVQAGWTFVYGGWTGL